MGHGLPTVFRLNQLVCVNTKRYLFCRHEPSVVSWVGAEVFVSRSGPRNLGGRSYAGATELEEAEEASVLVLDAPSSSSKGFLPQHRVVIIQWRNCLFMKM